MPKIEIKIIKSKDYILDFRGNIEVIPEETIAFVWHDYKEANKIKDFIEENLNKSYLVSRYYGGDQDRFYVNNIDEKTKSGKLILYKYTHRGRNMWEDTQSKVDYGTFTYIIS